MGFSAFTLVQQSILHLLIMPYSRHHVGETRKDRIAGKWLEIVIFQMQQRK